MTRLRILGILTALVTLVLLTASSVFNSSNSGWSPSQLVRSIPYELPFPFREIGAAYVSRFSDGSLNALFRFNTDKRIGAQRDAVLAGESFRLIFPHTANGEGGGLVIRSNVFLLNNAGLPAAGRLFLRQADGSPYSVSTNLGTSSQFDFSLPPGETFRLETDGTGPVKTGWIEVVTDIPLTGTGTFEISTSQGEFLSEVGIGESPQSTSVMLFADTSAGKNTAWAVANPSPTETVDLTLELRDLGGNSIATRTATLLPGSQKSQFITETFSGEPLEDFHGVLVVSSAGPEISVTTLLTRGTRMTSLPIAPRQADLEEPAEFGLARLGDGRFGGLKFQSTLILLNNSPEPAWGSVEFFTASGDELPLSIDGSAESYIDVDVPAGGAVLLVSDGLASPGITGWARVTADIPLAGGAAFTISEAASRAFVAEVGVPSSMSSPKTIFYSEVQGGINTGVGLTNPTEDVVRAHLKLFDEVAASERQRTDSPLAQKTVQLGPLSHSGLFLSELFPDVPSIQGRSFQGRLQIETRSELGELLHIPIYSMTLRTRGAQMTSLPVAPYKPIFSPEGHVEFATLLGGSTPDFQLSWRQYSQEMAIDRAAIQISAGAFDFSKFRGGDVIGTAFLTSMLVRYTGKIFVTNVTGDSADLFVIYGVDQSNLQLFNGQIRNVDTGVEMVLKSNPILLEGTPSLFLAQRHEFTFHSGLFRLPDGEGQELQIEQRFDAFRTDDSQVLLSPRDSQLETTTGVASGSPRIDAVEPARSAAGNALTVRGSGFSADPSRNRVFVSGVLLGSGDVETNSATELSVFVPPGVKGSELQVEAAGRTSNLYKVSIPFRPWASASLSDTSAGADAALTLSVEQESSELAPLAIAVHSEGGEWITAGHEVGSVIGTVTSRLLSPSGNELGDGGWIDLVVESSDSERMILYGLDTEDPDSDPSLVIEATTTGYGVMLIAPFGEYSELSFELPGTLS
ncbi:MAG: IPT/TIG domain-containing protein, partial [Acidobacteriota bacterium]